MNGLMFLSRLKGLIRLICSKLNIVEIENTIHINTNTAFVILTLIL